MVNRRAYDDASTTDKVRINTAVLRLFRENPSFVQHFREAAGTNSRADAQSVLDNVRDYIAEHHMQNIQPLAHNGAHYGLTRQGQVFNDIIGAVVQGATDPSYYRQLASRNVETLGQPASPMPTEAGDHRFNITNMDSFFRHAGMYGAARAAVEGTEIRFGGSEALAQAVPDHRAPETGQGRA